MFEIALKGRIPIIGVTTDDPVNFELVVKHYANQILDHTPVRKWDKPKSLGKYLYWTDDATHVTPDVYEMLDDYHCMMVVMNPVDPSPLIFDAGILPTPESMVKDLLSKMVGDEWADSLLPVVRGLSLKAVKEVMHITQARAGNAKPVEVRRTRASMLATTQGLYLEDVTYDFYVWPKELEAWLLINQEYFGKQVHAKLIPRGLMFEGPPGVGKSMAAKAIANVFSVPLYRFDIASTLDKYIGVSESRVAKILAMVDREAPCVLLLDEVEKIFKQAGEDSGVITRLLSQLLWWLAEHQSRVFTVMTTNDKSGIPPELYRKGRIDQVFRIGRLTINDASKFAMLVFEAVVGQKPTVAQIHKIKNALLSSGSLAPAGAVPGEIIAHADVAEAVYTLIKTEKWA